MTTALPPVGERIREARLRHGMSLRALARAVGVSASLISQIETGKSRPSVSTLYAITKALEISVEDVFDGTEAESTPPPGRPVGGPLSGAVLQAVHGVAQPAGHRIGPIVRPEAREVLQLDSGVTWERLGHLPGTRIDFLLVTYAPGGTSSSGDQLMRHSGLEYGFLIEGELTLTLGFEEHLLRPGDAVSFPSSTPHRYRNDGVTPAVGVWYVHEEP
ncbi:XRE family transcriptional regulator [Phytohabitans sp. ZYX-F-186]|uniref:XRE family transcriptional regulator n=1 Tax=Phytohabitans maris TaxID=3071409 RepID=A0ABU0ZE95_9ACTN|nr:XRE family transcriptional regulator [Phytohabitans sp. ZYX-F-186]MDQ7904761.1 XRE family transcriptional regulator [Phytohabitans sp. ZYX-F-186]